MNIATPISRLGIVDASSLAGLPVPARRWLADGLVPDRNVTLLGGDGGTGKSLLALQLAVAVSTGTDWLKTIPEPGSVIYLSAEDDLDELHRRLADITRGIGRSFDDLGLLQLVPRSGQDAVLAAADGAKGVVKATALWRELKAEVREIRPRLVVLDTLADLFAGDENHRTQARQFIGMLRGLALEFDLAVLVLAHPSLTGIASGSGSSGSTGWSNSVRSRLYFERMPAKDGEADPDLRRLTVKKSNYGRVGDETIVRWRDGMFRLDGGQSTADRRAHEARIEALFLMLLLKLEAEGRTVSDKPSASWAPKVFESHPAADGITKQAFERAMDALFAAGKIKVAMVGPASRQTRKIVIADDGEG